MTMILDVENYALNTGEDFVGKLLIKLKDTLVARGWTVTGSGDGLSAFENSGQTAGPSYDIFTASPAYAVGTGSWNSGIANSISNVRAWFKIKEPSPSTREFLFQRALNSSNNRMTYLYNMAFAETGFDTSGASATVAPLTGTSVTAITNSDTIAIGDGAAHNITDLDDWYLQIWVSDSARSQNVWPFYYILYNYADGVESGCFIYESLVNTVSGDTQPWIWRMSSGAVVQGTPTAPQLAGWRGKRDSTGAYETNMYTNIYAIQSTTALTPGAAVVTIPTSSDGKVRALPVFLFGSDLSYKGIMEHILYNPRNRSYPATQDVTTVDAKLCWGCFLFPWKQNSVPSF